MFTAYLSSPISARVKKRKTFFATSPLFVNDKRTQGGEEEKKRERKIIRTSQEEDEEEIETEEMVAEYQIDIDFIAAGLEGK